jgi:amidase
MTFRLPTFNDLQQMADAYDFQLNDEEIDAVEELIPPMFRAFDRFELGARTHAQLRYRDRDAGFRPGLGDDPLNAIVRRCSIKGASEGKLAGKRIGLKDNVSMAGIPLSAGSLVLDGYVPDSDATIVTRLLDAGAEIVAVLNMDNFASSGAGNTSVYGPILNPHSREHLAGGSSGGSAAALYYDYVDMAIGGDQGGSIRIPAAWCGVVGLKPTYSLVPYTGILGMDPTVDHAGPMARSTADIALMLEVIAGKDPLDARQLEVPVGRFTEALSKGAQGVRIGLVREGFGLRESEADVDAAVHKAADILKGMGATVEEVSIPWHRRAGGLVFALLTGGMAALMDGNAVGYHRKGHYSQSLATAMGKARRVHGNDFPPTLKLMLLIGKYLNERYHARPYIQAQALRVDLQASYDLALERFDVLAMPTTPMKAHKYEVDLGVKDLISQGFNMTSNTAPFNLTGHPSISIPCAKSNGLPIGLMLTGRHFDDAKLIQVSHAFESSVNWEDQ